LGHHFTIVALAHFQLRVRQSAAVQSSTGKASTKDNAEDEHR
jgi:hypothetical protein